ncbi:hypothetical protein RHGRI_008958 [Rhododendron griersonianum]|uniref:Uncharacterized protein n=1 Tax=Rhododendron griersonianum TaxID=479676 RepID=A0AAV6L3T0_9ERIC|nr:hypothetical protein RHGRI_008958 [Rhododendron griersonianum]
MADSNDSISVDMETIYLGGKEHTVRTGQGSVSVIVYGDQDKPALLTYPDLALNRERFVPHICHVSKDCSFVQKQLLCCSTTSAFTTSVLLGMRSVAADLSALELLGAVMCMGVTAGAYVLTLFAVCDVKFAVFLWHVWFDEGVVASPLLDERQSINVLRFLQAIESSRPDITSGLKTLKCRTLIFVGENSPFHSEAVHMTSKLDRRYSALVELSPSSWPLGRDSVPGPGLWIGGNGRATACDVGTDGVFPHGLRIIQAVPVQRQPKESPQPVVHLPRASLSRKHGLEAETYQDSDPYPCQKCIQIKFRKDKDFTHWMYTNSTCVFFSFFGFFLLGRCGGL